MSEWYSFLHAAMTLCQFPKLTNLLKCIAALLVVFQSIDGCQYTKYSPRHTMCFSKNTACPLKQKGVSKYDIQIILDEHNSYRQRVANGQTKQSSQPPAADMRQLEWDNELATVAQKWAEQCKVQHDCPDCRQLPRFRVGQNIYMYASTEDNATTDWYTATHEWYKEVSIFPAAKIEPFQHPQTAGHYTQLAWANTQKVGCGYTYYQKGGWFTKLYVCDYGPAGNILEDRMYVKGSACSACPEGTSCSRNYPGLCVSGGSPVSIPTKSTAAPDNRVPWWSTQTTIQPGAYHPWWLVPTTTTAAAARPSWIKPQWSSTKKVLLLCDFDKKGCNPETVGTGTWSLRRSNTLQGNFYEAHLRKGDDGNLYVYTSSEDNNNSVLSAFSKACLSLMYKKYPLVGRPTADLEVAIWRYGQQGSYTEFNVSPSANKWTMHKMTVPAFSDIYSVSFHMSVPRDGQMGDQYVSIDDIRLEAGPCAN